MPCQRARNKVYLGGYITRSLHGRLVALANAQGMAHNKFGFAVKLIEQALALRSSSASVLKDDGDTRALSAGAPVGYDTEASKAVTSAPC